MKTCPTCQKTYLDDFSHCPRDGARLAAPATETEAQVAALGVPASKAVKEWLQSTHGELKAAGMVRVR